MENSLMFVMYPNKDDDNVTISPRIGSKNAEPTFTSKINLDILPGTTVNDSMLLLKAVCRNCRDYMDIKAAAQPMIYAFGHGARLNSDSPSANLKRHIRYGHFTMDMVAATGTGGVPGKTNAMSGVTMQGAMVRDHDRANLAHAIIGCLALFVIWPLNVLFAGFFKNIKIHVAVSVVIIAFLVVAYALGIYTSGQFNRVCSTLLFLSSAPELTTNIVQRLQDSASDLRFHIPRAHPPYQPPSHSQHIPSPRQNSPPSHASSLNILPPSCPHRRPWTSSLITSTTRYTWLHRRFPHGLHLHHDHPILRPPTRLRIRTREQPQEAGRRGRPNGHVAQERESK